MKRMTPSILLCGGVHNDPGSRRKFLDELAKQQAPPHFVGVEWEQSVFERFIEWRPWVEREIRSRWGFLTLGDCRELSLALAWEGDAHEAQFPTVERLWLEAGFQETGLRRRYGGDADKVPKNVADTLFERLRTPPPPEPASKGELIDLVSRKLWADVLPGDEDFERDKRWAATIAERTARLQGGWIAIAVGWAHVDPAGGTQRLRSLLSNDFHVDAVCLAP